MSVKPVIVAINGSPHAGIGNTSMLIEMLRPTLTDQGFALEVVSISEQRFGYCVGCGLCLEKGKCWQADDHAGICQRILDAAGVILASPVYFLNVTAQMKAFLDRSLAYGHKPRGSWKPGMVICVSAGLGETQVAAYLENVIHAFGAFSVGSLTAMAVAPGQMLGQDWIQKRAKSLARDLAEAIRDKTRFPARDHDLHFFHFMSNLIRDNKGFMKDDEDHWQRLGLHDSFEKYVDQSWSEPVGDPQIRKAWLQQMIADAKKEKSAARAVSTTSAPSGAMAARSCRELIQSMPLGLNAQAASGLTAQLQFEISGAENFTAHLVIADGKAGFGQGPAPNPTLTIRSPADVWLGISQGRINGQQAFMAGKFTAVGDFNLLLRLHDLFK